MQLDEFRSLLSRFHIKPNKKLGQNFLLSEAVLDQIVDAADLSAEDTVLEIGPGLGFLTQKLSERAGKVIAVEKDRKMVKVLRKILKRYNNVEIIEGDALRITPSQSPPISFAPLGAGGEKKKKDFSPSRREGGDEEGVNSDHSSRYKVVANIPYYLTGKILQKFLSEPINGQTTEKGKGSPPIYRHPNLIVLLLQKEVAERIVAKPGQMSILSVSVQFYADPEIIAYVGKENFYPVPEVDSAIVKLTPPFISPYPPAGDRGRKRGGKRIDERKFFQLVKIGFSNKRKQLQNNLTAGLRPAVIPAQAGIQPRKRVIPAQAGIHSPRSQSRASLDSRPPIAVEGRLRGNDKEGGGDDNERDGNDKSSTDYKNLLQSLGLNPLCRAQDLSLEDWKQLCEKLFTPSLSPP